MINNFLSMHKEYKEALEKKIVVIRREVQRIDKQPWKKLGAEWLKANFDAAIDGEQ